MAKSSIILLWLILGILACSARHIPEKPQHVHSSQDYEEFYGNSEDRRLEHEHHKNRDEKRTKEVSQDEEVANDSAHSNEIRDSFDEYPIVTPKRAAMLLDRIMVALHHALEDSEDGKGRKINDVYRDGHYYGTPATKSHVEKVIKEKSKEISGVKPKMKTPSVVDYGYEDLPEEMEARSVEEIEPRDNTMDLQRRGHDVSTVSGAGATGAGKGRVYWRCYFNAVTCF